MIRSIRLQHFRSYEDASFTFDPGVTIIMGPNASGKTNLLESILVVARGGSYKAKDAELIGFNGDWARLDVQTDNSTRTVKLQGIETVKKSFEIDGQKLQRLLINRIIPTVLFEPDHLALLSGSPDMRRVFLDDLIEQYVQGYGNIRRHYKRVLGQRNALLKKQPHNLQEQLFVWNLRLSELGGQIAKERAKLVDRFNEQIRTIYDALAQRDNDIHLSYETRFPIDQYESALLRKLEQSLELDMARGFTAYGPHRDDMVAYIDSHPMQEAASRGENRTLVLALKVLELQLLEEIRGEKPLLLLDDVFSELDSSRRQALTQFVKPYQSFMTTTDADIVADYFASSHKIIDLS